MDDNGKISTYIQREIIVKEKKGVNLVSAFVQVKNVGLNDKEKQDVKADNRILMAGERRAMATCDGGDGLTDAKLLEISPAIKCPHLIPLSVRWFRSILDF